MRPVSSTPDNTRTANTRPRTENGDLPDSTQNAGPKLSIRTTRALMLDNSSSNDVQSSGSGAESARADGPYDGSGDVDHLETAEKKKAVDRKTGSQRYVERKNKIPKGAHVLEGGDYATHGEAIKWTKKGANQTGKGAPCIIV